MLKWIGILLVIGGSSGYGIRLYLDFKDAICHLRHFGWMLDAFSGEVGYRKLSLPECSKIVLKGCKEPFKTILRETCLSYEEEGKYEFSTCFQIRAKENLRKIPLSLEEKELIETTFEEMAVYDPQMQLKSLERKKTQLERYLGKREAELAEKKKVYTGLGVMVGLLLILILI